MRFSDAEKEIIQNSPLSSEEIAKNRFRYALGTAIIERETGEIKLHLTTEDGPFGGENLWAIPVESNIAIIDNIPVSTDSVHLYDEVEWQMQDGLREIVRVTKPSGQQTIQLIFQENAPSESIREVIHALRVLDCHVVKQIGELWSISIPSLVDKNEVDNIIDKASKDGLLVLSNDIKKE